MTCTDVGLNLSPYPAGEPVDGAEGAVTLAPDLGGVAGERVHPDRPHTPIAHLQQYIYVVYKLAKKYTNDNKLQYTSEIKEEKA
jgi:hypothetical protein